MISILFRAEMYGQTADECADAYLHYGKTLIELARQEIGVFWNAVKESMIVLLSCYHSTIHINSVVYIVNYE